MVNIDTLKSFKSKFEELLKQMKALESEAENIRSWYKYQNEESDSLSEDFIVSFKNGYYDDIIPSIDSLIDYEEESK